MRLGIIALVTSLVGVCQADEYHYKSLLVGTKAIGLGGAFTAVSDDLSGVFYNPAGLTQTTTFNSASISTFAWEKMEFKDVFSSGEDFSRSSFSIVPSFLGIGGINNDWHWSLGFAVSDLSTERNYSEISYPLLNEDSIQVGQEIQFANIDLDNSALNLGLGAGFKLNPKLSVGGALILKYKKFETIQGSGVNTIAHFPQFDVTGGFSASRRLKDETILAAPSIGLIYNTPTLDIGLRLTKDFTINRAYSATHTIFVSSPTPLPPTINPATAGTVKGSKAQQFATNISLGFAKRLKNFEWSFDIDHFTEVDVNEFSISEFHPTITRDYDAVTNFSLGLTFYSSAQKYFRFGVFTDIANTSIDITKEFQRTEAVNMLGFSVDYTTDTFGFPISIGAYAKYGEGQVRLADLRLVDRRVGLPLYPPSNNHDIIDATKSLMVLFISANF